jgi:TolB-like protein
LLKLATGDGMALIFYHSPEDPVECALEISRAIKEQHSNLRLRMGVNSGPVSGVVDVNGRASVAGAGINMAQRIMDCGDAGHILLSKRVAEDLEQFKHWRPHLYHLGECEVKHGEKIEIVNLFTAELGNRELPEKFKRADVGAAKRQSGSDSAAAKTSPKSAIPTWPLIGAAVLILIAVFVIGSFLFWQGHESKTSAGASGIPEKSIAVLPFENLSSDKENAYFAEGIQDEILTRLAKVADLKVIARTSSRKFQSAPENLPEIARQLGVRNILEGSVQKANDQVRVNVQLINAQTEVHLWADIYDRKLTDLFAVESDIARAVVATLQAKLTGAEQSAIAARPTDNSDAHDLYLRGRYFEAKRRGGDLKHAIDYFNQAITKDPNYAPAYAGLAESYLLLPDYSDETSANTFPKARAAGEKALALDDKLPEAHVAMGLIWQSGYFDFERAGRELRRAIELNPNYAEAHYFLAILVLHALGQFDQAEAEMKRALVLDPFSLIINTNLGYTYTLARRYPEAIAQLNKALEMDPNFGYAHILRGTALELEGDASGAIKEFERVQEIEKVEGGRTEGLAKLARAYALQGDRPKALQFLQEIKELDQQKKATWAYGYATAYLGLGDKSQAIDWLQRSYETKESGVIGNIGVDPLLDGLRGDPRFDALVQEVIGPKEPEK